MYFMFYFIYLFIYLFYFIFRGAAELFLTYITELDMPNSAAGAGDVEVKTVHRPVLNVDESHT